MAGSKNHIEISRSNIMRPAFENLSVDKQRQFEDYMNNMWVEVEEKFLSHITMDR